VTETDLTEPLWRALAVYRFASLGYAVVLVGYVDRTDYSRLGWAWATLAVMAAWTVVSTIGYARPDRRAVPLLTADLLVTAGLLLSTAGLQYPHDTHHGLMPVTATWVAGPVLAWAIRYGRRAGLVSAIVLSGCDIVLRRQAVTVELDGSVLMILAGVIVGHLSRLAAEVEQERRRVPVSQRRAVVPGLRSRSLATREGATSKARRRRTGDKSRGTRPAGRPAGSQAARAGRLAEAAAAGRLGASHSIQGRVRDLGGSAEIRSLPGEGTEVELRVPR
jgi:hypothetical protein